MSADEFDRLLADPETPGYVLRDVFEDVGVELPRNLCGGFTRQLLRYYWRRSGLGSADLTIRAAHAVAETSSDHIVASPDGDRARAFRAYLRRDLIEDRQERTGEWGRGALPWFRCAEIASKFMDSDDFGPYWIYKDIGKHCRKKAKS